MRLDSSCVQAAATTQFLTARSGRSAQSLHERTRDGWTSVYGRPAIVLPGSRPSRHLAGRKRSDDFAGRNRCYGGLASGMDASAATLAPGSTPHVEPDRFPTLNACRQVAEVSSKMVSQMPGGPTAFHSTPWTLNVSSSASPPSGRYALSRESARGSPRQAKANASRVWWRDGARTHSRLIGNANRNGSTSDLRKLPLRFKNITKVCIEPEPEDVGSPFSGAGTSTGTSRR